MGAKIATKTIPDQYYIGLKESGHIVPRNEKTGEPIPFKVGADYYIISAINKEPYLSVAHKTAPII